MKRRWSIKHLFILLTCVLMALVLSGKGESAVALQPVSPEVASPAYSLQEYKVSGNVFPDCHRYRPQVAYNHNHDEFLVVWHNTWDNGIRKAYGRRLDFSGKPVGDVIAFPSMENDQVHPNVVYNGADDVYLVVWMWDVLGDNTVYQILVQDRFR